jgi:hypothetical protein
MMDDRTLLAVAIADEAGNQPHEGKVAVGKVIMNRTALKFRSDGTIPGTILAHMQFSGFWCDFVDGHYTVFAHSPADAMARATAKLVRYSDQPQLWADCLLAADQAMGHIVPPGAGPQFMKLTDKTVNYYAPDACSRPEWATPDNLDAVIFAHHFYHE